jgi:2-polyprenyl-3-methyl-5-hydroxy-6-metoxy-1,4-benzoquinol methylase
MQINKLPKNSPYPSTSADLSAPKPDVAEIMGRIRSDLRQSYEAGELVIPESLEAREIDSKDLHTANAVWDFPTRPIKFQSHRAVVGPAINGVKRVFASLVRDRLLAPTFKLHYDFNGAVIRYLNQLNLRLNSILRRSADDLRGETYAIERRLEMQFEERLRNLSERVAAAETGKQILAEQISSLDSVVRGLERLAARTAVSQPGAQAQPVQAGADDYLLLENRFRGSTALITERLKVYPQYFTGQLFVGERVARLGQPGGSEPRPVLEIGAGRGELQRLFKAAGIKSYGIDSDRAMVSESVAAGLDVRCEDAAAHLASLLPDSLGGVIAIQVIEHLPRPYLRRLLELIRTRVVPGGLVVFETINTASVVALTQNYLRDPTHVPPIHPESMRFIAELAGFETVEMKDRSPFPAEAALLPLSADAVYTPGAKQLASNYNENIRRLNDLLFGSQDYSLVLRVPPR